MAWFVLHILNYKIKLNPIFCHILIRVTWCPLKEDTSNNTLKSGSSSYKIASLMCRTSNKICKNCEAFLLKILICCCRLEKCFKCYFGIIFQTFSSRTHSLLAWCRTRGGYELPMVTILCPLDNINVSFSLNLLIVKLFWAFMWCVTVPFAALQINLCHIL